MSRNLAILSLIVVGMVVPSWAGKVYTRDEAVKTAMENSPDIKDAEESLKSANSQVTQGYGNAYPSIDLSATVTRIFGLDDVEKSLLHLIGGGADVHIGGLTELSAPGRAGDHSHVCSSS
mgnify:CR=1 FL=1